MTPLRLSDLNLNLCVFLLKHCPYAEHKTDAIHNYPEEAEVFIYDRRGVCVWVGVGILRKTCGIMVGVF